MDKIIAALKRNALTFGSFLLIFSLASGLAYYFVDKSFDDVQFYAEDSLDHEADIFFSRISEKFAVQVDNLVDLRGLLDASNEVSREEFYIFNQATNSTDEEGDDVYINFTYAPVVYNKNKESFVKEVSEDTSMKETGYPNFSITPDTNKEKYLPALYIYPEENYEYLLGQDLLSDPVQSENILIACESGHVSVSDPFDSGTGERGAVELVIPIYEDGITPDTPEERCDHLTGIVSGIIDLDPFISLALSETDLIDMNADISVTETSGVTTIINTSQKKETLASKFYGDIEIEKELQVTPINKYMFRFSAPLEDTITSQQYNEPFGIAVIYLITALFVSSIVHLVLRAKSFIDIKKQYSFISILSHQLRTPITKLRWSLDMLEIDPKCKIKTQEALMDNILTLNSIIQKMLLYIEITNGNVKDKGKELISFEDLCKLTLEKINQKHDASRIVRKNQDPINEKLYIESNEVALSLSYVIENGLIYSPKNEKVIIDCNVDKDIITIRIIDKGIGIKESEKEKIFSGFFRASNSSLGKNAGSGVSLSIAKLVIEANKGTIRFNSEENKGTEFIITLPIKKQAELPEPEEEKKENPDNSKKQENKQE